jgi:hypothetical protein
MDYLAAHLATGWLSVALASAKDKTRPVLDRTMLVEEFESRGVRLVATDGIMLLHAWVSVDTSGEPHAMPERDEAPDTSVIVADFDGRAKSLLSYGLAVAQADDAPMMHFRLGFTTEDYGTFPGMETPYLTIDLQVASSDLDVERVRLPIIEGRFPAWQPIVAKHKPVRTAGIALAPDVVKRLAKLGPLHGDKRIGWTFGGVNKMAGVEVIDSWPYVAGVVMPVTWDVERNRPYEPDPEPPPAPDPVFDPDEVVERPAPDWDEPEADDDVTNAAGGA